MNPQRYEIVQQLFIKVCDLDPLQRSAVLDASCADDPSLREDVERLLREDRTAGGAMLESVAGGMIDQLSLPSELALNARIGHYTLRRLIGQGGMGAVYEAQQDHPRRLVALKLLRPMFATQAMLRRFEYEAQVLGLLEHQGVAKIFEAGAIPTDYGQQPYFAMELVSGATLTDFARRRQLSVRQRLSLMADICDAVQHAHAKGVVHRDLKPGNILVDEAGQAKILDFGVARATQSDVQATTLHTEIGQLVGTVAYMSPEQASGDPNAIDTRSDVYSLGVICHELLMGRLPYELQAVPTHEAVRIIREQDPSRLGRFDPSLRGDVETIVAKALEKEKDRRYQSAAELAADLRRHLNEEPITAVPPTAIYQLRKFARRNKALMTAAMAAVLTLILGVAGTSFGLYRAIGQRDRAIEAEQLAETRLKTVSESRDQATKAAARSAAIVEFLHDLLSSVEGTKPSRDRTMGDFLDAASARVRSNPVEVPDVQAEIMHLVAHAYIPIGRHEEAAVLLREALRLRTEVNGEHHQDTILSMGELSVALKELGQLDEAEQLVVRAIELARETPEVDPLLSVKFKNNYGTLLNARGQFRQALEMHQAILTESERLNGPTHPQTLRSMQNIAESLLKLGEPEQAEAMLRQAVEKQSAAEGLQPLDSLKARSFHAGALAELKRFDEAEAIFKSVLEDARRELGNNHPETLAAMGNLSGVYLRQRRMAESETLLRESLELRRKLYGPEHPGTILAMHNLSGIFLETGRLSEAEALLRQVHGLHVAKLGADHPTTVTTLNTLGKALVELDRAAEARPLLEHVVEVRRRVLGEGHLGTLGAQCNLAEALCRLDEADAATELFEDTIAMAQASLRANDSAKPRILYAYCACLSRLNRHEDSERLLLARLKELESSDSRSPRDLMDVHRELVDVYEAWGKPEQVAAQEALIDAAKRPASQKPASP